MKRSPTRGLIKERTGAFSAVTGGRALSFHRFSMGEAAAPLAGNAEGAKLPRREAVRKDKPGSLGTEEKVSVLTGYWPPSAKTFRVSSHRQGTCARSTGNGTATFPCLWDILKCTSTSHALLSFIASAGSILAMRLNTASALRCPSPPAEPA